MSEISLVLSIIGIILSISSLILYIIREKRNRIHGEKIRIKRKLFNDWYQQTKDFADRLEFTETVRQEGFTTYGYKLKKKDGEGYEETSYVRILIERMMRSNKAIFLMIGYGTGERVEDVTESYRLHSIKKMVGENGITVPNDMLPSDPEKLREELIKNIVREAKDNGVRQKYLEKDLFK